MKDYDLPKPPYITIQITADLFLTITGSLPAIHRFADLLLIKCRTLYIALESAKEEGATVFYTTTHPYNSLGEVVESNLTNSQIEALIRKRSTLSQLIDKEIWLGAFEGDHNLGHIEPVLGLLNHTINESVWRLLPPIGFPEFDTEIGFLNYKRSKIIPDRTIKTGQMKHFFENLSKFLKEPIVFALNASSGALFYELAYHLADEYLVETALDQSFSTFTITPVEEIEDVILTEDIYEISCCFISLSMSNSALRSNFQNDPYIQIASALDSILEKGQRGRFEVICRPFTNQSIARVLHYLEGMYPESHRSDFKAAGSEIVYAGARKTISAIQSKNPMWLAIVRLTTTGHHPEESELYLERLSETLEQYTGIDQKWVATDLRESFEITLDELVGLTHFPLTDLESSYLHISNMKSKNPPELYSAGINRIGQSLVRGKTKTVYLPEDVRDRHVYIVGKSGTGKSTLIETIARQDIINGKGVAVIDPHGDVIDHLLESIPNNRIEDCVYFNPQINPISLEILAAKNEQEIDLLSDDLISMFRRTSESWGDRMQAILQMTFQTLLRVPGSSFTDITNLLVDEAYRSRILSGINNPQLRSFWEERFDKRQAEPILIRMDRLTTSTALRQILTQTKNSLNFYDVISEGKIFLANLNKGFLGSSTSHLIGSIIVSQIQLAAMRQMHLPIEQRIPFSLFVDEVQNFTNDAFGTILSEARKQKLRLTIAHQFVSQLPYDLQKAVFGNVGTMIFFGLSPDDLGAARYEIGDYDISDVANLPPYHALCRPVTAARDTFTFAVDPPPLPPIDNPIEKILDNNKREFGFLSAKSIARREELVKEPSGECFRQTDATSPDERHPASASPLTFNTNTEKILHFIKQAEYLSQPQIIALTGLQPSNASTALKRLVKTAQIKNLDERRPKIYFLGKTCKPTTHNLLIRDLLVKIYASNFAIQSVSFTKTLSDINPDLVVEFVSNNREVFPVYFEIDRGTEGVRELVTKAERYNSLPEKPRVGFIFEHEPDMHLARANIEYPFISYSVLDSFVSLRDQAFLSSSTEIDRMKPFFYS